MSSPSFAEPIGSIARVTGAVGPDKTGEVMLEIRGGREAFYARPADGKEEIPVGDEVLVIEYLPPRTVLVCKYDDPAK